MNIEIYSDIVCPWCYIGERRLSRALATLPAGEPVSVVFRPYQLDPGAPHTALPFREHMARRFGPRVESMLEAVSAAGASEGIAFAWDKALSANTHTAHRLLRWAEREHGADVQRGLAERLFALHFTEGGNVASIDDLVRAASSIGFDAASARAHLESRDGVQELDAAFDHARRLGIEGVPAFVIDGRYAVHGAQPVSTFVQAFERAMQARRPAEGSDGDGCADGTCAVPVA